jgi:hypothetical protein
MKLILKRCAALLPLLAGPVLSAQSSEFQILVLNQRAGAEAGLPATDYRPKAILYLRDIGAERPSGNFQWVMGGMAASSQKAHTFTPASPGNPFGGSSRSFSPGGALVAGLHYHTNGTFQFRVGLELRFHTESREASSGDTGSSVESLKARRWATVQVAYLPRLGSNRGIVGLHAGYSDASAPAPNRETGLFAGLRF